MIRCWFMTIFMAKSRIYPAPIIGSQWILPLCVVLGDPVSCDARPFLTTILIIHHFNLSIKSYWSIADFVWLRLKARNSYCTDELYIYGVLGKIFCFHWLFSTYKIGQVGVRRRFSHSRWLLPVSLLLYTQLIQ